MAHHAYDILVELLGGQKKLVDALLEIEEKDPQSFELARAVFDDIEKSIKITEDQYEALGRLQWAVENAKKASPDLLRNNIFKAANAAGLKLPSGMF